MAGKPTKVVEEESPVAAWFASLFGGCWKEPSTEADIKFEDLEKKDRKEKKEKKTKKKKDDAAKETAAPAGDAVKGSPPVATSRFLIDNTVLQIKSHPGVAFRYSKTDGDKVKSGPGPAKWGETVEGVDEGDGWLKVGSFYLPMLHQNVPIITPVAEARPPSPQRPPASPARNAPASPCNVQKPNLGTADVAPTPSTQTEGIAAAAAEPCSPVAEDAEIQICSPESHIEIAEAMPDGHEPEISKLAEALIAKVISNAAEEGAPLKEQPPCEWFKQPSVGTWLILRPKAISSEAVDKECSLAKDAIKAEEVIVEQKEQQPEECAPLKLQEEECTAVKQHQLEECAPIEQQQQKECAPIEPCDVDWRLLPSVGTWLHRVPLKIVDASIAEPEAKACDVPEAKELEKQICDPSQDLIDLLG